MRLDMGPERNRRKMWLITAAAVVAGVVIFGAGFGAKALLGDDSDGKSVVAVASPATGAARTVTATIAGTRTPAANSTTAPSPTLVVAATLPPSTLAPPTATATATPDFTKQPSVEVVSVEPALGTHLEVASVDIKIEVNYQAGRDSNVLGWELYYCAGPNDCNTYGYSHETVIVPGAAGNATIGGPFPAGGNYLRPIVVCRYTVVIAHYVTAEAQWQSQMSPDERCQGSRSDSSVRITDVTPAYGSVVSNGEVVTAYVEYTTANGDQIQVISRGDGCVILGARTIDIERDSSGVATIDIVTSPPGQGILRVVEAFLLDQGVVKDSYNFGGC
jgi:hypothetical protein